MSVQILEQTTTSRTDDSDFQSVIERYKSNGWTLDAVADGKALLSHPAIAGSKVLLTEVQAQQ